MRTIKLAGLALTLGAVTAGVARGETLAPAAATTPPIIHPVPLPIHPQPGRTFAVRDPSTGKPISENTTLTLPNGKTMRAGDYYQKLNDLEDSLKTRGQTLTTTTLSLGKLDLPAVQAAKLNTASQKLVLANAALDQKPELAVIHKLPGVANVPGELKIPIGHIGVILHPGGGGDDPVDIGGVGAPTCTKTSRDDKSWGMGVSNDLFGASLGATMDVSGTCNSLNARADGYARGKLFGANFDLVTATLSGTSVTGGASTGNLDVKVLGRDVVNHSYSQQTISIGDKYSQQVSYGGEYRFMIGPIPVDVQYGLGGSASFAWSAGFNATSATAQARPGANTWVFVQGGVDIVAAGAYAGASLTLLSSDMIGQGLMELGVANGKTQFHGNLFLSYAVDSLSGSIYVDAYVYVPAWGIPPWEKKEWRDNLFNWAGYRDNRVLLNETTWVTLV